MWNGSIEVKIIVIGQLRYSIDASFEGDIGNIARLQNFIKGLENQLEKYKKDLNEVEAALISTKEEYDKTFPKEDELNALLKHQQELNSMLMESDNEDSAISVEVPESVTKHHRTAI
jgi:predicted RNase H-like nuclease (RuvC/YqgF family)